MRSTPCAPPGALPTILIIGPSAVGKSCLVRELHRRGLVRVHATWTTRPPRPDERGDTLEHRFVSETTFAAEEAAGRFWASTRLFGLPHRYGVERFRPAQRTEAPADLVMVRAPLVAAAAALLGAAVVYQVVDRSDRPRQRLVARGDAPDVVAARLADNELEQELGAAVADRVFTNHGTPDQLATAVAAALRCDLGLDRDRDRDRGSDLDIGQRLGRAS